MENPFDDKVVTVMSDGKFIAQLSWRTYKRIHAQTLSQSAMLDLQHRLVKQGQATYTRAQGDTHTLRVVQH
jgi:hypothetical protein